MGLLTSLFSLAERRSLENPSTPLSAPDDWLFDSLGSFRASSGVNVNRETALTSSPYWRCVSLLTGDIAKTPLTPYLQTGPTKVEDKAHPAYRLLRCRACPEIASLLWKRVMAFHAISEGNGYSFIMRDRAGRPLELWPLSPMKTYPVREGTRLWYVTEVSGVPRKIQMEDIFHLKGLSFDGLVGYSVVAKMREAIGLTLAAENFGSVFFRNNGRPGGFLKHPGKLKPETKQNLRESWERMHTGLENSHRTAVLEEGMDYVPVMHNAREAQLLELRHLSKAEIANFFGVPLAKINEPGGNYYKAPSEANKVYVDDGTGLGYWLPAFAEECYCKLLSDDEQEDLTHSVEFDTTELLRPELPALTTYYDVMSRNKILLPDEIREKEGYDPLPGGAGQKFPEPIKPAGPGGEGDKPPGKLPPPKRLALPPPPRPELVDSTRAVLADALGRMVRRIAVHAERAAKQPRNFLLWLDTLRAEHRDVIVKALVAPLAAADALAGHGQTSEIIADFVLATTRQNLLEISGQANTQGLLEAVTDWANVDAPAVGTGPWSDRLAAVLLETRKRDEPMRSAEDALAILEQIPERRPNQILPTFPVNRQTPYTLTSAKLRDVWDAGKVQEKTVRLRLLVATQDWIRIDWLKPHIKDLAKPPGEDADVEGSPTDCPYVVQSQGCLFIYDGHHRLTAKYLRGVAKTRVYLLRGRDVP